MASSPALEPLHLHPHLSMRPPLSHRPPSTLASVSSVPYSPRRRSWLTASLLLLALLLLTLASPNAARDAEDDGEAEDDDAAEGPPSPHPEHSQLLPAAQLHS